ncbi:MAG: hypothetical protein ACKVVT_02925 [Dehalococcoidia bacterium]
MTTREAVHALLDRVNDEDLAAAEEALRPLVPLTPAQLHAILDAAPFDDEPLTPRELELVEAGEADLRAGRVRSQADVEAIIRNLRDHD